MICDIIEKCIELINHSKKTLIDSKGGKSKYLIDNKSKSTYSVIDIENCVYKGKDNDTKCDFALITDSSVYYIELKGSDVKKGIEQILSTMSETEKCFKGLSKKTRLVVTKFTKPDLAKKTKQYKDLVKKIGNANEVIISQNSYKEII